MYVCIYVCLYACMYERMYVCIPEVIGNVYFDHHSKSFSTMTLFNFLFDTSRRRNRLERHSVRAGHFHDHVNIRLLRPPSRAGPIVSAKPSWNEQVGGPQMDRDSIDSDNFIIGSSGPTDAPPIHAGVNASACW